MLAWSFDRARLEAGFVSGQNSTVAKGLAVLGSLGLVAGLLRGVTLRISVSPLSGVLSRSSVGESKESK
jgi:hypothetical protein